MSIRHSRYQNRYLLVLSIFIICLLGMNFMQHKEMVKETELVDQSDQGTTFNYDLNTEYSQTNIEAILITKREQPIRTNRRWVELDSLIANKLWSHLRSKQIDASDYFDSSEGLPSFNPPHYDAIVILNDTEKLNITMDGSITEVSIGAIELFNPILLLRYDQSLVTSIDKVLDASVKSGPDSLLKE